MDDKTLSDFMPKTNSEGEIVYGEFSTQSSIKLTKLKPTGIINAKIMGVKQKI